MLSTLDHDACVDGWLADASAPTHAARVEAFEVATAALWARARVTLGDVTLTAIFDRVLIVTAQQFPSFAPLRLDPSGRVDASALRERPVERAELEGGIRFALVELLTVIGNLTADILTPALHAELSSAPAIADEDGTS
jgi:hypothetical protein